MTDAIETTPRLKISWFFGILGAFLIFVVIAKYSSQMADHGVNYDDQRAAERYATLAKVQAADTKRLTTADWVDKTKNTVRIPIDEAIPEEIEALKGKPVQMSNDVIPGTAAPATMNTVPATTLGQPAVPAHGAPSIPPAGGKKAPATKPKGTVPAAKMTPATAKGASAPTTETPPPTNVAPAAPPTPATDAPNK